MPEAAGGAYTPTLAVAAQTVIRRERRLPLPGELHVEVGDQVSAQQVVASTALPGRVTAINLARELNVQPGEVGRFLLKREGEPVARGEPLAEYRALLGLFRSVARSPIEGVLESVSSVTGQAMVRGAPLPVELRAYVDGVVVETEPGQAATVECTCALIQGILGLGGEAWGELVMLAEEPGEPVPAEALGEEHAGKVVVCGAQVDCEFLERACEIGPAGVVVGAVRAADVDRLLGHPLGVAITGQERIGYTLVLTEGFGSLAIAEETFALLRQHEGRTASLNGATQIRAGVLRPEIVVPVEADPERVSPPPSGRLVVGSRVRLVRDPYFGRLGTVIELPPDPQELPSEARVRVLRARLEDGSEVTVPRANVELIER